MSADEETKKMKEHFTTGYAEKQKAWGRGKKKQLQMDICAERGYHEFRLSKRPKCIHCGHEVSPSD